MLYPYEGVNKIKTRLNIAMFTWKSLSQSMNKLFFNIIMLGQSIPIKDCILLKKYMDLNFSSEFIFNKIYTIQNIKNVMMFGNVKVTQHAA